MPNISSLKAKIYDHHSANNKTHDEIYKEVPKAYLKNHYLTKNRGFFL